MTSAPYRRVSFPRAALFSAEASAPAKYWAQLQAHAVNHGLPARRRAGRLLDAVATSGAAATALASRARFSSRQSSSALDDLVADVTDNWGALAAGSPRLPAEAPELSVLQMELSSARTTFFFAPQHPWPLVVAKEPRGDGTRTAREIAALKTASSSAIAPLYLGRVREAHIQEGLPGFPPWVPGVRPESAHRAPSESSFRELGSALAHLATATGRRGEAHHALLAALDLAGTAELPASARRLIASARRDLGGLDTAVLQHGDLSPQNYLVHDASFVGLVDWETADHEGVPGFDVLHAAVSLLLHGVGVQRWTARDAGDSFRSAWPSSPLFREARTAVSHSVVAAGVDGSLVEPLTLAFFARRLGRQLGGRAQYDFGVPLLTDMLTTVCAE